MSEALRLAEQLNSAAAFPAYPKAPYARAAKVLKAQAAELESLRAERDALKADLEFLDHDKGRTILSIGTTWYYRQDYGMPFRRAGTLRAAIDAAKEQKR